MMPSKYRLSLLIVSLAACGEAKPPAPDQASAGTAAPEQPAAAPVVLFVGTSLTAGYGLDRALAWPAVIQRKIDSVGLRFRVVNAGVSGETSAGALRRIKWLLAQERPAVLVLETGANDGLRGQTPDTLRANLLAILATARQLEPAPRLVLMAMESPPNLGDAYTVRFRAVYPEVAREVGAVLVPFFLQQVAGIDSLNLPDGIHPTARGHELGAAAAWVLLEPVLREVSALP